MVATASVVARPSPNSAASGSAPPSAIAATSSTAKPCAATIQPLRRPSQGRRQRSTSGAHRKVTPNGRYSANTGAIDASVWPLPRRIGPMPPCTKPSTAPSDTYSAAMAARRAQGGGAA
nr:hypothetical protein [Achromobacter insuavis]